MYKIDSIREIEGAIETKKSSKQHAVRTDKKSITIKEHCQRKEDAGSRIIKRKEAIRWIIHSESKEYRSEWKPTKSKKY